MVFISFRIMSPCNDTGPAFLLNEIGPTWHPLHVNFLLVYSNIYPLKFPKIQLVSKLSLVRPSLIPQNACQGQAGLFFTCCPCQRHPLCSSYSPRPLLSSWRNSRMLWLKLCFVLHSHVKVASKLVFPTFVHLPV